MISFILSKLFRTSTLAKAIALKKEIYSVNILSSQEVEDMHNIYQDMALNIKPYPESNNVVIH